VRLALQELDQERLEVLAHDYEEHVFCFLTGLQDVVTHPFRDIS